MIFSLNWNIFSVELDQKKSIYVFLCIIFNMYFYLDTTSSSWLIYIATIDIKGKYKIFFVTFTKRFEFRLNAYFRHFYDNVLCKKLKALSIINDLPIFFDYNLLFEIIRAYLVFSTKTKMVRKTLDQGKKN